MNTKMNKAYADLTAELIGYNNVCSESRNSAASLVTSKQFHLSLMQSKGD